MADSALPRASTRTGRNLLALFGITLVLPGVLLAALAVRAFLQDRRFADQQLREAVDRAADVAVRDLERQVREWRSALERDPKGTLAPATLPNELRAALTQDGAGVVVRLSAVEHDVWPARQLLYHTRTSVPTALAVASDRFLAAAEDAELRGRDYPLALRLYHRAVGTTSPGERPAVLLRTARTLRKAERHVEALALYRQLVTVHVTSGGLPVDLVARYEICSMLDMQGAVDPLVRDAAALYGDLVAGRWSLEKARYLHYSATARRWLARAPAGAAALSRWGAVEDEKRSLTEASVLVLDAGAFRHSGLFRQFAAIQGRTPNGPAVVLLSRRWLAASVWPSTFRATSQAGFDVTLVGPDGDAWFGPPPPESNSTPFFVALRVPDAVAPWRVRLAPHDPAAFVADANRRRTIFVVMLLLVLALLAFGTYLTVHVVRRELEIARLQADFVSTVSHEFRSPLTGIRQLGELLVRGRVPSDERRQEYYERITRESDRLTRLVEHLLDFSQMEDGRKEYRFERLDTARWLRAVVNEAAAPGLSGARTIVLRIPDALPSIEADPSALSSALHNLIDNAVKYSPGRDAVWVEAAARNGTVSVRVRDEGVGISEPDRRRIFEKFYRAQGEVTRQVKGAGLGLSIVERIVRAHGGRVECESRLGEGTTFTIELRAAPARAEA
jgi:signal transduction histidine kinase